MTTATTMTPCEAIREFYEQNGKGEYVVPFHGSDAFEKARKFAEGMRHQLSIYAEKVEQRNTSVYIVLTARGQLA